MSVKVVSTLDWHLPAADRATCSVLGRPEHEIDLLTPLLELRNERSILITGGAGSIGSVIAPLLRDSGVRVVSTDLAPEGVPGTERLDVRDEHELRRTVDVVHPSLIIHLAAAKHAPAGELDPLGTAATNLGGTQNVLSMGRRVVFASTCKAANPETTYGATKLVGERTVLHAGGSVARFYNVVETRENVFEIWRALDADAALPVSCCWRYFITLREAIGLILWASILPSAVYTLDPGEKRFMPDVATSLYPGREIEYVQARRGDRREEPAHASHECLTRLDPAYLLRVEDVQRVPLREPVTT